MDRGGPGTAATIASAPVVAAAATTPPDGYPAFTILLVFLGPAVLGVAALCYGIHLLRRSDGAVRSVGARVAGALLCALALAIGCCYGVVGSW